jgi:hypothetical protein
VLDISNVDFVASHEDYERIRETIFATPVAQGINLRDF